MPSVVELTGNNYIWGQEVSCQETATVLSYCIGALDFRGAVVNEVGYFLDVEIGPVMPKDKPALLLLN